MESLARTANRGSVSTGYDIDYSIKFEADNSEQLYRTPSSDGNMKTWTYSVWFKRTELGASQTLIAALDTYMYFETNDTAWLNLRSASTNFFMATNRVFRDTSAWYHAVIACDTTDSTAADRLKLYINGVRETSFSNNTYENIDGNDNTGMNKATVHRIGQYSNYGSKFSGYMAEANLIDGQALAPTEFGEFDDSGIWKPKEYTGTYGTNGFYLDFADASDLGDDESGNGNDFTEGGITSIDQATDTPTNNFCIFNAVQNYTSSTVLSDGGTLWDNPAGQNWQSITGTFAVSSGKWYWEVRGATYAFLGIADVEDSIVPQRTDGYYVGHNDNGNSKSIGMYSINGQVYNAPGGSPDGTSYTSSSMIGFALDMDNRKMWISKDGTWISTIGDPTGTPSGGIALTNLGDYVYPAVSVSASNGVICAFGGIVSPHVSHHNMTNTDANGYGAFKSSPPSGYYSLCTKNLAEYG